LPEGFASGNGRIEAVEIDIAAKTPGRVDEILLDEGDFGTAGTVLARMDTAVLQAQMRAGELSLALEIPPGFARDIARGRRVRVSAWVDGAMPQRAETVRGYLQAMHALWLADIARRRGNGQAAQSPVTIETRFRYNPEVESVVAMVPAVIPLLLMLIPAMLAALRIGSKTSGTGVASKIALGLATPTETVSVVFEP